MTIVSRVFTMMMFQSRSRDDDSMVIVSIEAHGILLSGRAYSQDDDGMMIVSIETLQWHH
jgi:hypothetical protein